MLLCTLKTFEVDMLLVLLVLLAIPSAFAAEPAHNRLSAEEQAEGWTLLFDGETSRGWDGLHGTAFPERSWAVEEGALRTREDRGGVDIVTARPYEDFELRFDWKLSPGGNSGLKYMVQQDWASPAYTPAMPENWKERTRLRATGLEYQLLDDAKMSGKPGSGLSSCGSLYLLKAPENKRVNPPGEWNTARIVVRGNHGEHWLNGVKLLEYELGSPELLEQVDRTKFRRVPGFGIKGPGYIALTYHGSPAWYRDIKLRELK